MATRERFITREATRLLSQDRIALVYAFILMLVPYTGWLSLAILALVTLRKGFAHGGVLVVPVTTAHVILSLLAGVPLSIALVAALVRVLPCYAAACVLRLTTRWRFVALALLMFVLMSALLLQCFAPHFIQAQYTYLESSLRELESGRVVLDFWRDLHVDSSILAHYLFGFQAVGLVLTTLIPLMFARSIQSRLFYPGEFHREIVTFRGDKWSVLILLLLVLGAQQGYVFAIDGLPLVLFYFILAGLSFSAHMLEKMKPLGTLTVLFAPLMLLPLVVLPVYVILGAFDGLFNFRLYLRQVASKTR